MISDAFRYAARNEAEYELESGSVESSRMASTKEPLCKYIDATKKKLLGQMQKRDPNSY
jgi:hypothetical protein